MSSILPRAFYERPVVEVARSLIGKRLVRRMDGDILAGIILETEAYDGEQDQACHAHSGKTRRNAAMYGPAGHAYIYFTYGMHWLLNCVTGPEEYPAAVLIRALTPVQGLELIARNRQPIAPAHWCDGPAKLTRAFSINGELNGYDLCRGAGELSIMDGIPIPTEDVQATPRIGINYAGEPWKSMPWRFVCTTRPDETPAIIN
ncbi:MAG: DNA-3-methyladenine glycosylase [Chloroflexi bacterium]|nr:DNA-3-methyladenine glycosylase [Chloroflexota bacterium]